MTMPAAAPASPAPAGSAAAAAQTPPAAPTGAGKPSASERRAERAAKLKTTLDAAPPEGDATTEPAAETSSSAVAPATPQAGASTADPAAADDPIAKARADRLARIAEVRAKEAASEADRERRNAGKESAAEVERLRKRVAELEPQVQKFKSPAELLAYAEKEGLSAKDVIDELRARVSDPTIIAQRQAKSEADKIREELAAERKAREDLEARLAAQDAQARAAAEGQSRAMSFLQQTEAGGTSHPLTAAFLKRHGAQAYVGYANQFVAPLLPEEYSLEQLHDHFEQLLDELQVGGTAAPVALPANGESRTSPKNGAGQPVTTLSNALTAERATVTEEVPLARLPRAERTRRLKEKLDREPPP